VAKLEFSSQSRSKNQGAGQTTLDHGKRIHRICEPSEVVSAEILRDGYSVGKTSRTSQLGGALIGEALFGNVGGIVGALTGTVETKRMVSRIDLQIIVRDPSNPSFTVNIQNKKASQDSSTTERSEKIARDWLARIDVFIRSADEMATAPAKTQSVEPTSVADEIAKLATLQERGLLTDAEFQTEKRRLLQGNEVLADPIPSAKAKS
jgi:hypothetical protein